MEIVKSCTNCIREYACKWDSAMCCEEWQPDLDTERATAWQLTAKQKELRESESLQIC